MKDILVIVEDDSNCYLASASYESDEAYQEAKTFLRNRFPTSHKFVYDNDYKIITTTVEKNNHNSHDTVRKAFENMLISIENTRIAVEDLSKYLF